MPAVQSKRWCMTISILRANEERGFQLTGMEWLEHLQLELEASEQETKVLSYCVVGYEVGEQKQELPEPGEGQENPQENGGQIINGYQHLQCYFHFLRKTTLSAVKRFIGLQHPHLEVSRGNDEDNRAYCTKDDKFFEIGEPQGGQGRRTDLQRLTDILREGGSLRDCWEASPETMVIFHRGLNEYAMICNSRLREPKFKLEQFKIEWQELPFDWTKSHILWGGAGIGKTSFARAILPKGLLVSHMDDLSVYDPTVHDGIIFDDMSFLHLHREAQIHLVDVEEGRSIHIRYRTAWIPENTKKIFTTNTYQGAIFMIQDSAIQRRLDIKRLL